MRKMMVLGMFAIPLIVACTKSSTEVGFVRDDNRNYALSQSIPPLQMPPGVKEVRPDPYYVIPDVAPSSKQATTLAPPGSLLARKS